MVGLLRMPSTAPEIAKGFRDLCRQMGLTDNPGVGACYIMEDVGTYRPGNSGPAAVKFARNCGRLDMLPYCWTRFEVHMVLPSRWMLWVCGGAVPKEKTARKNRIKERMQMRYPELRDRITLAESDALGILSWALDKLP